MVENPLEAPGKTQKTPNTKYMTHSVPLALFGDSGIQLNMLEVLCPKIFRKELEMEATAVVGRVSLAVIYGIMLGPRHLLQITSVSLSLAVPRCDLLPEDLVVLVVLKNSRRARMSRRSLHLGSDLPPFEPFLRFSRFFGGRSVRNSTASAPGRGRRVPKRG